MVKEQSLKRGLVIRGSRNLFTVRTDTGTEEREAEYRIKGKVLKGLEKSVPKGGSSNNYTERFYNPLAPGDVVEVRDGLILGVEERRNLFARFNQKGQAPQILGANVDLVICVTTPLSPPFRPRFLDRVLLAADAAGIPACVVCNKYDLTGNGDSPYLDTEERLSDFERMDYPVFRLSALSGFGLHEFRDFIAEKFSVLVGQSGVGKSTLLGALIPGLKIKTGEVNAKYDRGNHTTTQAVLLDVPGFVPDGKTKMIDTPGIRRFVPAGVSPAELGVYMREFSPLEGKCSYGLSCSHEKEPGCKIMEAVHAGVIHEDRYKSFLRIRDELAGKRDYLDND